VALARSTSTTGQPFAWTVADLGAFYVEHRVELKAHATRILKDASRAEEVVQDALIRVILAAPELNSKEHALSYLYRTIQNLCIDIFRIENRRPNLVALDDAGVEVEGTWAKNATDNLDVILAADDAAIVRQALSMLSLAERSALIMWEIEGRSTEEIARELGIKKSTVRHTVSRARASLRRVLSELVVDETRGLTALDLLSNTYRKASELSKKTSKVALSFFLVLFAFLGFSSMPIDSGVQTPAIEETVISEESTSTTLQKLTPESSAEVEKTPPTISRVKGVQAPNVKTSELKFPGLDKSGTPIAFTVADSTGAVGNAYFHERALVSNETDFITGQVIKTEVGAASVLISQTLFAGEDGLVYSPVVSFGQGGYWIPLAVRLNSTDIVRQMSGNYLFTAYIAVESVIETPIKIAASSGGRDLTVAPRQLITRLVLDPSKTRVLRQAIYVVEEGAGL